MSIDQDGIIGADIFTSRLEILSASIGFDGTVGVGQTEEVAREFGLAWDFDIEALDVCPVTGEDASDITRIGGIPSMVNITYDCDKDPDRFDGFPMCFSWPILPCSVQREHILYTRSDGATFNPSCISTVPNNEFNERHCLVMFDDFINRQLPGEAGRLAMDKIEIVGDLLFVGPKGELVSGKGLSRVAPSDETSYKSGPLFIGSRLSPLDTIGEGFAIGNLAAGPSPNSGVDLFGDDSEDGNLYRLRLYYSGGMTLDGLSALRPDMFSDYFTLQFSNGEAINEDNIPTTIGPTETTVTVLGLADLGLFQEVGYDQCYTEDADNYIDIILRVEGNNSVLDNMTVLAFSKGKFLYNPGGPGPTPFGDVRYTAPAPANQIVNVKFDPKNVHQTTFCLKDSDTDEVIFSRSVEECEEWRASGLLRSVPFTSGLERSCPKNLVQLANSDMPGVVIGSKKDKKKMKNKKKKGKK